MPRIEWRAMNMPTWVQAAEPAYDPDGKVYYRTVEDRWRLVRSGAKHSVLSPGYEARLVDDDGTVLETAPGLERDPVWLEEEDWDADFDGETYEPEVDRERLRRQLARVRRCMSDGEWRTLAGIEAITGDPQASVSARLRDLRKAKFGGHTVERRRYAPGSGLYTYRVLTPDNHRVTRAEKEDKTMKERIYARRVVGNVKGSVDVTLGPRTIIVGPNGSGKSAVVSCVEVPTRGAASDITGRDEVKQAAMLFTLAAPGADALDLRVEMSDDAVFSWRMARNPDTGGLRDPVVNHPYDVAFPVAAVRENMEGSPEKAHTFLLRTVGGRISRDDVLRVIPLPQREAFGVAAHRVIAAAAPHTPPAVDVLLTVRTQAQVDARRFGKERREAEAAADAQAVTLRPEPTDALLEDARLASRGAAVVYHNAENIVTPAAYATLEAAAVEAVTALENVTRRVTDLGAHLPHDPPEVAEFKVHMAYVLALHQTAEACGVCGTPLTQTHRDHATASAKALAPTPDEAAVRAAYNRAVEEGKAIRLRAEAAVNAWTQARARMEAQGGSIVDPEAARRAYEGAEATLRDLENARQAWATVRSLRARAAEAATNEATVKALVAACDGALVDLLESARVQFVASVQALLPPEDTFDLVLRDGDKDVCRYGFVRNGVLHTALSGAEWARLTLALGIACTPVDARCAIYIPEERAFDPHTLRAVMVALADAPAQVILQSPIYPAGRLPRGWTLVEVGVEDVTAAVEPDGTVALTPLPPEADAAPATTPEAVAEKPKPKVIRRRKADAAPEAPVATALPMLTSPPDATPPVEPPAAATPLKWPATTVADLKALGYTDKQIERMSADALREIMANNYDARTVSIGVDGRLHLLR